MLGEFKCGINLSWLPGRLYLALELLPLLPRDGHRRAPTEPATRTKLSCWIEKT
jgi:hypothetical protein